MKSALALALALTAAPAVAAPPAVFVNEADVVKREVPPHNGKGMSTAYRISDAAPEPRAMEFKKRVLHKGALIGLHVLSHDEVYYVLSGEGDVTSDGLTKRLKAGGAAYLYKGNNVGIAQVGDTDLAIIVAYPTH